MNKSFVSQLYNRRQKNVLDIPENESVKDFTDKLFNLLFIPQSTRNLSAADIEKELNSLSSYLTTLIYHVTHDVTNSQLIAEKFFDKLPEIYNTSLKDAEVIARFDPAASSVEEVLVAYPGFYAVAIYRLAHQLFLEGIPTLPRLLTEYAHRQTGIDIHPGATIGESFFIDHGTGIVIGETAVIGNNVKLYQGVTIGGLLSEEKTEGRRHPIIEDNVTIYGGAVILGGNTVIGRESIIGGNVWLTQSVPSHSYVYQNHEVLPVAIYTSLEKKELLTA
ncbi:MAG: serine acetyltransferase [Chitinophagaceae bacterium]|nr:serine acetyltransferase [Chitinophagaceae bacterium]